MCQLGLISHRYTRPLNAGSVRYRPHPRLGAPGYLHFHRMRMPTPQNPVPRAQAPPVREQRVLSARQEGEDLPDRSDLGRVMRTRSR